MRKFCPDDHVILKRMILELFQFQTLQTTRRQNGQLHHRLDQLLRRRYGPRGEKFDPNQPFLFPDLRSTVSATPPSVEAGDNEEVAETANAKKKNQDRRRDSDQSTINRRRCS